MNKKFEKLLCILAVILTFLATVMSSTASLLWAYQPKTPKSLQRKKT